MGDRPFKYEVEFWNETASMIQFFEDRLIERGWKMSPSRGYDLLVDAIQLLRANGFPAVNEPAFDFVMERLAARAAELRGTEVDFELAMVMEEWRDREAPVPADPYRSLLQIFDWFLPLLRRLEGKAVEITGASSAAGEEVANREAVDFVLRIADWCSKQQRFQTRNAWGWSVAYPWVDFVRDEIYEWHMKLKPALEPPPPVPTAFSSPWR
jgi:hypothetical protein